MNLKTCPMEKEVRALVARGQWPVAADDDMRSHVSSCRCCSELVLVDTAFQRARAATVAAAKPGSAGALWWRAQLRRRNAALERISRPLFGAEVFALAISLLAGLGFVIFEARHGVAWLSWLEGVPENAALHWDSLRALMLTDPGWSWAVFGPAAAAMVLLGGFAVYLATDRQ